MTVRPETTTLIMDLSTLANDATQRGDDRAVNVLRCAVQTIMDLQRDADRLAERRERERERQRLSRDSRDKRDSTSSSKEISNSSSNDYSGRHVTSVTEVDEKVQRLLDLLRGQVGDSDFPAIDAFVKRRPYHTWKGWLDAMLTDIGPGSQYLPADLVRVCKDDAALERPIASPRGLRSFLLGARVERVREREGLPSAKPVPEAGSFVAQIRKLATQNPGRGWYIPKNEVAKLGEDVLRAYEAVGGAERFLNIQPEYLGILIRDFGQAMRGAA